MAKAKAKQPRQASKTALSPDDGESTDEEAEEVKRLQNEEV